MQTEQQLMQQECHTVSDRLALPLAHMLAAGGGAVRRGLSTTAASNHASGKLACELDVS